MKNIKKIFTFAGLICKYSPLYMLLIFVKAITTSANILLNVYLPKLLIDALANQAEPKELVTLGALIVANNVLFIFFTNFYAKENEIKSSYLNKTLQKHLSEKIMNLEYSYLEDPYYLDLKDMAEFGITNQNALEKMITAISDFLSQSFTIITLLSILISLGYVIIVAIIVAGILSFGLLMIMNKSIAWIQKEIIPINRKFAYYFDIGSEKKYQKDMRIFNLEGILFRKIKYFLNNVIKKFNNMYVVTGITTGGIEAVGLLFSGFCYVYIGLRTLSPNYGPLLSIGDLTFYVTSAVTFHSIVFKISDTIGSLSNQSSFLEPYFEFISLVDETKESENKIVFEGEIETLEFKDVTFTYPKAKSPVLKNISFSVQKGEKISIVGLNGAGKSTLVKLICRMYKADSGEILINGRNIYDYDYLSYMNVISTVFQDYSLFNFTILENITCKKDSDDIETVNRLVKEVGLEDAIAKLPNGLNSTFGKEYTKDGIELSGGQSQKIAIARALYKKASLVILDEPASALDPISEAEIYEKFNSLVEDKTAIYISHRMSSSVFCDKILIIDGGTVSDFDSHKNLMNKKDSLYYKLFNAQAENYQLEANPEYCPEAI